MKGRNDILREAPDDPSALASLDPAVKQMFEGIFSDLFASGGAPVGRHLPLVVARGYRGRQHETRHEVAFQRRKACTCNVVGCDACHGVGWTVSTEKVQLSIPPSGGEVGTLIRLGPTFDELVVHHRASADLVEAREGETTVTTAMAIAAELVEEGSPRADELHAKQREHEDLLLHELRAARAGRRARASRSRRILGVLLVALAASWLAARLAG